MSHSIQEEILCVLWVIASVLSFGLGFKTWGWVFAVKGVFDCMASIGFAIEEVFGLQTGLNQGV